MLPYTLTVTPRKIRIFQRGRGGEVANSGLFLHITCLLLHIFRIFLQISHIFSILSMYFFLLICKSSYFPHIFSYRPQIPSYFPHIEAPVYMDRRDFRDLPLYIGFGTWKNSEGSLEARLERHETWSLFFGLANRREIERWERNKGRERVMYSNSF